MISKQKNDISYQIVRSRRATADIVIERDGSILVRAQESIPDERIGFTYLFILRPASVFYVGFYLNIQRVEQA